VSIEITVPPVAAPGARSRDAVSLAEGRQVYLSSCTRCHVAEPVRDYTASRWPGIIADMSERARLSPAQERAVLAYVLAASAVR
jgi:mono/diheme cytochrome c family protein